MGKIGETLMTRLRLRRTIAIPFLTNPATPPLPKKSIYTRYSVLFFAYKLLCKKLWGGLWGKTGRKQAAGMRLVSFIFRQILRLTKLVVYLLNLVVEVFVGVVRITSVHGGRLHVFVERMSRPKHDCFQIASSLFRPGNMV